MWHGDDRIALEGLEQSYIFMDAEDSSDNEGDSDTTYDGCGGGDDQSVGGGETDWGGGGQGDNSGEDMDDSDSSNQDEDGKLDFHQSLLLPCVVVVVLLLLLLAFTYNSC